MKIKTILCKGLAIFLFIIPILVTISLMLGVYYSETTESMKIINMAIAGLTSALVNIIYIQNTRETILTLWREE